MVVVLAATDPANPYGAALPWPASEARPQRAAGALVILSSGELAGWIGRGERSLSIFGQDEPAKRANATAVAEGLSSFVGEGRRASLSLERIDGNDSALCPYLPAFLGAGFIKSGTAVMRRREGVFARRRR